MDIGILYKLELADDGPEFLKGYWQAVGYYQYNTMTTAELRAYAVLADADILAVDYSQDHDYARMASDLTMIDPVVSAAMQFVTQDREEIRSLIFDGLERTWTVADGPALPWETAITNGPTGIVAGLQCPTLTVSELASLLSFETPDGPIPWLKLRRHAPPRTEWNWRAFGAILTVPPVLALVFFIPFAGGAPILAAVVTLFVFAISMWSYVRTDGGFWLHRTNEIDWTEWARF